MHKKQDQMVTADSAEARREQGLSRRRFLGWSAAIGAAGAAFSGLPGLFRGLSRAEASEITDYTKGTWIKSGCNMCGGQCGIDCFVDSTGILRKIEPLRDPNNIAGNSAEYAAQLALTGEKYEYGTLCCKGNSGRRSLYDPDRLQSPMKRVGPRGAASSFVPITWDEALTICATRLRSIKAAYGARSIHWFGEDHSFTHIQQDFCQALGTRNYSNHAMLCDASRKALYKSVFGNERPIPDFENANHLLVFGWNFLSAIKWTWLAKSFARARVKADFKFVYVDPVFTTTAAKADSWIAVKPGTDGALALAICHRVLNAAGTGNYDEAFVQAHGLGFNAFKDYLNNTGTYADGKVKDAAWAALETGLPQATIETMADELIAAHRAGKKICIDVWSGPGHKANATQGGRAIVCLMGLFGRVDRIGGMINPEREGVSRLTANPAWPSAEGWQPNGVADITLSEDATATRSLRDKTGTSWAAGDTVPKGTAFTRKYLYGHSSGSYVDTRETLINKQDFLGFAFPARAAVIVFQNLMMSMSDPERTRQALEAMDFVMCIDTHMSETAEMADVVIPGSNYLERYDSNARWVTFRSINLRQPVVKSWIPGGRSEAQFFMDLGGAIGLAGFKTTPEFSVDENYNKKEWQNYMAKGWTKQMTWDELKAAGVWMEDFAAPKGGTHFEKWKKTATGKAFDGAAMEVVAFGPAGEQVFTVRNKSTKAILGFATSAAPTTYDEAPGIWPTPSGKYQFWDPTLNAAYVGSVFPAGANVTGDLRYHPLPAFKNQEELPTTNFPLYFLSWKEVEHTHSRTFNNEWLMEMKGENRIWIHPTTAAARSIEEEDLVYLQSPYGVVRGRAHVTYGIRPDTVGFVRGFGHWALGKLAKGRGVHDGWLMPARAEVHSAQLPHKDMVCQVTKA